MGQCLSDLDTPSYVRALAEQEEAKGVYFVGRLANYKYFNMDQVIADTVFYNTFT